MSPPKSNEIGLALADASWQKELLAEFGTERQKKSRRKNKRVTGNREPNKKGKG
jgi:hypothetical protein